MGCCGSNKASLFLSMLARYIVYVYCIHVIGHDRAVIRPHYIQLLLAWFIHETRRRSEPNTHSGLINKGSDKAIYIKAISNKKDIDYFG